jgi:hypothetical protein
MFFADILDKELYTEQLFGDGFSGEHAFRVFFEVLKRNHAGATSCGNGAPESSSTQMLCGKSLL